MSDQFLFAVAPYLVALSFPAICALRCICWRSDPEAMASEFESQEQAPGIRAIWRCTIAAVLLGHLLGVLFPASVQIWNRQPLRLFVLEASGFVLGSLALLSLFAALWRRLHTSDGRGARSSLEAIVWTLIFMQVASGVAIAPLYRWASSWSVVTLTPYLLSLWRLRPAVNLIADMPFLVRLHVVCTFAIVLIAPFAQPARFIIVPLHGLTRWALPPLTALCLPVSRAMEAWISANVQAVFPWGEEEED